MSLSYLTASDQPTAAPSHVLVVAHSKEALAGVAANALLGALVPGDKSLFAAAADLLSPTREAGACTEFLVPAGDVVQHVGVAVTPKGCSRHNAPGRPHAITDLVRGFRASGDLSIVLILESVEHAFAAYCAVSKAFSLYSKKSSAPTPVAVSVYADFPREALGTIPEHAAIVGQSIQTTASLVDMPTNVLYTDAYVEIARATAQRIGCDIRVIRGEELKEAGLGGIYGVGAAAEFPPSLVILSHTPAASTETKSICLVGKGIVYDTGGLSIKDKNSMPGMKNDMGGSAGVLGAFEALVRSGYSKPLHALLCIAENSVSARATRPDDVHTFYSGKTVEINNTDAEGRLVLADGVAYAAANLNPSTIIDMATLTGAQGIATGKKHAAIYCNDEELETLCTRVGRSSGDLVFPIPYCPEFFRPEFRSTIADMKNSVADRANAQASCAGQFIGNHIECFVEGEGKWLHIDMAYPSHQGERATGFGVALLFSLLQHL